MGRTLNHPWLSIRTECEKLVTHQVQEICTLLTPMPLAQLELVLSVLAACERTAVSQTLLPPSRMETDLTPRLPFQTLFTCLAAELTLMPVLHVGGVQDIHNIHMRNNNSMLHQSGRKALMVVNIIMPMDMDMLYRTTGTAL